MNAENVWRNYGMLDKNEKLEFLSFLLDSVSPEDVKQSRKIMENRKLKEKLECEARNKEQEERRKVMNMFDSKAPPLFRNRGRDSEAWINCLTNEPTQNLREHIELVKKNPRNFGSIYAHQVPEFIQAIEAELMRRQQTSHEKGIIEKIKEKLPYAT